MTPEQLAAWLEENVFDIAAFMDYEPTIESEEDFAVELNAWFQSSFWNSTKHRFIHLGVDGRGSQFAAWLRPDETQVPVVYFDSEEGPIGAVATSCENWAKTIAYAPGIKGYVAPGKSRLDCAENWMIDPEEVDPEEAEEALEALADYRAKVEERFGELESLELLMTGLEKIEAEFVQWVETVYEK